MKYLLLLLFCASSALAGTLQVANPGDEDVRLIVPLRDDSSQWARRAVAVQARSVVRLEVGSLWFDPADSMMPASVIKFSGGAWVASPPTVNFLGASDAAEVVGVVTLWFGPNPATLTVDTRQISQPLGGDGVTLGEYAETFSYGFFTGLAWELFGFTLALLRRLRSGTGME